MNSKTFRFLVRLGLFLVPVALYFAVTISVLSSGGELIPLEAVAEAQMRDPTIIFGRAYRDQFRLFKMVSTRLRNPEVLGLGSSRVMQLRSAMFVGDYATFYNAGGGAASIYEVRSFLEQLDQSKLPKVVIVNLDEEWFHPIYAEAARAAAPWRIDSSQEDINQIFNLTRLMLADILAGRYPPTSIFEGRDPVYHAPAIGIEAIIDASAFRSDGSHLYGPDITQSETDDERLAEIHDRIRTQGYRFVYGDIVDDSAITEVEALMQFARDAKIELILFSPPYAPSIYAAMVESGSYTYMFEAIDRIARLAAQYGIPYYNFMDGGMLGTDGDFLDGLHGSEYIYLRMLLEMLKDPNNPLIHYTDAGYLNSVYQAARPNQFEVFGPVTRIIS